MSTPLFSDGLSEHDAMANVENQLKKVTRGAGDRVFTDTGRSCD